MAVTAGKPRIWGWLSNDLLAKYVLGPGEAVASYLHANEVVSAKDDDRIAGAESPAGDLPSTTNSRGPVAFIEPVPSTSPPSLFPALAGSIISGG